MTTIPLGLQNHGRPAWRRLDWTLLVPVLLLCLGGLFAIKSARHVYVHPMDLVHKEALGIVLGIVTLCLLALSDYEILLKQYARFLYPLNLCLLTVVLVSSKLGHASHGAQRWISLGPFELQPSEVAKIILICTLAMYLAARSDTIRTWPTLLKSLVHIGIPMLLIARQPDLGTALVLLGIWFGMTLMAGARLAHLALLFLAGVLLFAGMWHFNVLLKGYQKSRLEVFLNPAADPRDTGYHLRQSEIAIGSGQFSGEGYERGRQSNGKFIPEQYTDFIFTVVGEEGGFVSCIILLALYLLVLIRGVAIMATCKDTLGRLLAAGIVAMLTFHIVVNIGMTLGIMPVVGVPLPFFSYGLSSLLVNFCAIGLLMSIAARKYRVMF
jgi:rod shape determining protein RodA